MLLLTPEPGLPSSILMLQVSFQVEPTNPTRMHPHPKAQPHHWLLPVPTLPLYQWQCLYQWPSQCLHPIQYLPGVALYCYYHAATSNLPTFFHLRIWNCDFWQICSWFPILMQRGQISQNQFLTCVTIVNSPGSKIQRLKNTGATTERYHARTKDIARTIERYAPL